MRLVAAPDKFKGTATAAEVASAIAAAAAEQGWECDQVPMADGGEGTLDALGGPKACWRLSRRHAVIEMAEASGLQLVGGPEGNDAVAASTYGTGELIGLAAEAGASSILVGVGGSASTDGGLGALEALHPAHRFRGIDLKVACDVRIHFTEAAERFGPQKGATPAQVRLLTKRLERLIDVYRHDYGVDVGDLEGGGAAGGLAGGLAAISAELVPGFDAVAEEVALEEHIEGADLVITGEGLLDSESFDGKVVGGVWQLAVDLGVPVVAIVGQVFDGAQDRLQVISLTDGFGRERAVSEPLACINNAVAECLGCR